MKFNFKYLLPACFAIFALASCEKDETQAVYNPGASPALTSSQTNINLLEANESQTATVFAVNKMDFGFGAGAAYTLQLAKKGNNFDPKQEIALPADLDTAISVANLNQIAIALGLATEVSGEMEARVKIAVIGIDSIFYSNTVTLQIKPYAAAINYSYLWVPGNYQGWAPDVAPQLVSVDNNVFIGYINFNNPSPEFKFTSAPNWDNVNYGVSSSTISGNLVLGDLSTTGGNVTLPAAGYYNVKVNLGTSKFEAFPTAWGLIGDAVPVTGWDSDQDLTYDELSKTWIITLALNSGSIKFRANDGWDLNYGDDGVDGIVEANGANISVGEAGNYTITLDLHDAKKYTYTVIKN
ncbi:MAG: SusE domain-containing protein [Saprospiraceae bacterium]